MSVDISSELSYFISAEDIPHVCLCQHVTVGCIDTDNIDCKIYSDYFDLLVDKKYHGSAFYIYFQLVIADFKTDVDITLF